MERLSRPRATNLGLVGLVLPTGRGDLLRRLRVSINSGTEAGSYKLPRGHLRLRHQFHRSGTRLGVLAGSLRHREFLALATASTPVTLTTGTLTIDGGSTLTGTDSFVANGLLSIGGNTVLTLPGTVDTYGGVSFGGTTTLEGVTLNNHSGSTATLDVGLGSVHLDGGAVINNLAGGTFSVVGSTGTNSRDTDGSGSFTNAGTLTNTSQGGAIEVPFTNTGSVNVQQGTLGLGVTTNSGAVAVTAGASLGVESYTQTAGSTVLNGGTIDGTLPLTPVRDFSIPIPNVNPVITVPGPDGNVWFNEEAPGASTGALAKVTPAGQITQIPTPLPVFDFVFDSDGNIWFSGHDYIGEMTQAGGLLQDYPIPSADDPNTSAAQTAIVLTLGPDGNIWYIEPYVGNDIVGRLTPSGQITEFPIPLGSNGAAGITTGPDGSLWFEATLENAIGRITPSGIVTIFNDPANTRLYRGLTSGPNGNLWATTNEYNTIVEFNTAGQLVAQFPVSGSPYGMTLGPDGNLWYDENTANNIGQLTPQGAVTEVPIPTPNAGAEAPIAGPDGNIWFAEYTTEKIGEVVLSAPLTSMAAPSLAQARSTPTVRKRRAAFPRRAGAVCLSPSTAATLRRLTGSS